MASTFSYSGMGRKRDGVGPHTRRVELPATDRQQGVGVVGLAAAVPVGIDIADPSAAVAEAADDAACTPSSSTAATTAKAGKEEEEEETVMEREREEGGEEERGKTRHHPAPALETRRASPVAVPTPHIPRARCGL